MMKNGPFTLEVCVDSVESAIAAEKGGANRLELCANLVIGGTTPTPALFHAVRKAVNIPLHVMSRPRFGDFCYSEYEVSVMEEELQLFSLLGADGAVFGALTPDGALDLPAMRRLKNAAGEMRCTLHRCFDVCADMEQALEDAVSLGMHTILTSGGHADCIRGASVLKQLALQADGRIEIMAGAGLRAENIRALYEETGVRSFHMSGKKTELSPMRYRKENVHMGLPGISEYERGICDEEQIRRARATLDGMESPTA